MVNLDFWLGCQLASYRKEDSPPTRVRLLPVSVIQALCTASQVTTTRNISISNIAWVAFFFLLRPGRYCKGGIDTSQHPFRIKDVQVFIGQQPYNAATAPSAVLTQANFVASCSQPRRTASRGNQLDTATSATPKGIQWRPCVAEWHTFDAMAPPTRRLS